MEKSVTSTIFRFIILLLLQGLIFRRFHLGGAGFNYIQVLIYPLFIALLPIQTNKILILVLGFIFGLALDFFYDSPGLHASALLFTAFTRQFLLSYLQPRGGFKKNAIPNIDQFGRNWFVQYISFLLVLHLLWYFSVEAFQWSQILIILLKTILSFIASMIFIAFYMLIFNPKS